MSPWLGCTYLIRQTITYGLIRSKAPKFNILSNAFLRAPARSNYGIGQSRGIHESIKYCAPPSSLPFASTKIAEGFRRHDNIPEVYDLIYRIQFPYYLVSLQITNVVTLLVVLLGLGTTLIAEEDVKNKIQESPETSVATNELKHEGVYDEKSAGESRPTSVNSTMDASSENVPILEPMAATLETYAILVSSLLLIIFAFFRIQRMVPARIYVNKKRHAYAVFYGHFLPGKTIRREFVAGTVRPVENSKSLWHQALYQDGTGARMVLLEHNFRRGADFNFLLGIAKEWDQDSAEE